MITEEELLQTVMQTAAGKTTEPVQNGEKINYQNFYLDMTAPAEPQRHMLTIDEVPVIPAGGLTAVTGRAKQGKTQYLAAVCACILSGRSVGRMQRKEAPEGAVVWVDTEQSRDDLRTTIERVYHLAGIKENDDPKAHGLHVFQTASRSVEDRQEVIRQVVADLRPAVLIIDGIRDIMHDFNSITETEEVLQWLKSAAEEIPKLRTIVVLHTNPGGDKMRGHLGTEIENKLTDKFTCTKENGIFSVSHTSRGRELQTPFTFTIDRCGQLCAATLEEYSGAVEVGDALAEAVPEAGAPWEDIVKKYAKLTGLTQAKAKEALKAKLNTKELIKDKETKLFYRAGTPKQNNLF